MNNPVPRAYQGIFWATLCASAIFSIWLADSGTEGFSIRLAWFMTPLLLIVLFALAERSSQALITGSLLGCFIFLCVFSWWESAIPHAEGLVWVSYLMCFPGAFLGVTVARVIEVVKGTAGHGSFVMGLGGAILGFALSVAALVIAL